MSTEAVKRATKSSVGSPNRPPQSLPFVIFPYVLCVEETPCGQDQTPVARLSVSAPRSSVRDCCRPASRLCLHLAASCLIRTLLCAPPPRIPDQVFRPPSSTGVFFGCRWVSAQYTEPPAYRIITPHVPPPTPRIYT